MEEESISHINSHLARHLELVEGQTCDPIKLRENSGLIREGYKKTKLGWIPEEWEIKSLDDIGDFSKGKGISKMEISSSGKPCIRYAEIYTKYDFYTDHLESYVSEESALNSREISYGDLLFAGSGETLEDIGKCVAYLGKEDAFAGGDIVILRPKKEHARYLGFLLNHSVANRQKYKLGQGHSVVHIYSSGLKKLKVPLPPIKEQQKIATILSTWDRAIAKQEQLITAKQEFKKGLMQLLLTGKKRFEGFEGEWEMKSLSEISSKIGDGLHSTPLYDKNGDYKFINGNNLVGNKIIITENTKTINEQEFLKHIRPLCNRTILLSINGTIGNIAFYDNEPVMLGKSAAFINIHMGVSKEYIAFQLQTVSITNHFKKVATGSTIKNLGLKSINSTKIPLPDILEQEKIVNILRSSEKEIELLQTQLVQMQGQKRGLMQRLLTGKVRVEI